MFGRCLLVAVTMAMACLRAAPAAEPAEAFVRSSIQSVDVSPSGQQVAMVTFNGSNTPIITIGRFENGKVGPLHGIAMGDLKPLGLQFKGEDRLIVTVLQKDVAIINAQTVDNDPYTFDRTLVLSIRVDGGDSKVLLDDASFGTQVQSLLHDDPRHVVLATMDNGRYVTDLFKVDIESGDSEVVERGRYIRHNGMDTRLGEKSVRTVSWLTDANGVPYLRLDSDDEHHEQLVFARPIGSARWYPFAKFAKVEAAFSPVYGGLASPTSIYVVDRGSADRRALWEYDMATGKPIRQVLGVNGADAQHISVNGFKGTLLGATFTADGRSSTVYTSKALAAAQAALNESFPQFASNEIAAYSRDFGVLVVRSEGPGAEPRYMLLDARRMETAVLGGQLIESGALGETRTLHYAAADGRQITAFLTLPRGGAKNLPMVVMPHGGPEAQDTLDYEGWRQFLASRGYAVLQPQFRGSDGFGAAHERAGHGQWAGAVQDDVRAGVAEVVKQGIADADRICIFGWSYGGYMALAGAAFSPDLYKCAVSGAGLSDLGAMMQHTIKEAGGKSLAVDYWLARMGGGEAQLAASPARFADEVKIPVLLIHGTKDWVVPIQQSEIMAAALTKAGKDVTFVRLEGQGHSPDASHEPEMLRKVEAFLAAHIGR